MVKSYMLKKCSSCHGLKGEGVGNFPPVWGGSISYNTGAGLSKLDKMATWLKFNMPSWKYKSYRSRSSRYFNICKCTRKRCF